MKVTRQLHWHCCVAAHTFIRKTMLKISPHPSDTEHPHGQKCLFTFKEINSLVRDGMLTWGGGVWRGEK